MVPDEIAGGPDAEGARPRFLRFLEQGGRVPDDENARRLLAAILSSGAYLSELLLADVGVLTTLAANPWLTKSRTATAIFAELDLATRGATDLADFKRRLRVATRREMLRLGARELGWGTTAEVAQELAALADAALELAYRFCDGQLRAAWGDPETDAADGEAPAFVVMAMGKLGGQELNFSSDVDLIYFYATDAGQVVRRDAAGNVVGEPRTLHSYYAELSRRISDAIEDATADGFVFRVDLRLRPEGRNGPLCNSLLATERYYETFGRTWERQALLRARPCAGDKALGERILEMLDPFIYPRHIAPRMVDDIRELRGMFRPKREEPSDGWDVKLGGGGIRDVELVVQTLQLLHAGKRRDLRGRSTPSGLRRLQVAGLLSDREARTLDTAYRFWRQLEHRLQIENNAQTQRVPAEPAARLVVARRLGFPTLEAFDAHVAAWRAEVLAVADTFDDPEPDLSTKIGRVLDRSLDRGDLEAELGVLGFRDVDAAAAAVEAMGAQLSPPLLVEITASPDPDRALGHFRDVILRGSQGLLSLIREHPQLRRMLATLFGVSERLSRLLVIHPEMWEPFVASLGEPVRGSQTLGAALDARLVALDQRLAAQGDGEDPDAVDEAEARELRRFQTEEVLRVGLHDVAGNLPVGDVARQLTDVAEACLTRGLARMFARLCVRYGTPSTSMTVLGLGSLGAYEMRYGSDLDLVVLYAADGQTSTGVDHRELFARAARRLISSFGALLEEGRLYSIDTSLRPSGEQGLLVTTTGAFERYHHEDAAGWERIALLRARVVFTTAPTEEAAAFARVLGQIAYERPFSPGPFAADLRRVRARVEAERGKVPAGSRHVRFDPGGIMDVEFLAALGQLAGGATDLALRTTETTVALARLVELGWPATLVADYALLRTLAMRMRLLRDRPEDVVSPTEMLPLARTLGVDPTRLAADIDQAMKRIRESFLERFPAEPAAAG